MNKQNKKKYETKDKYEKEEKENTKVVSRKNKNGRNKIKEKNILPF